MFPRPLIQYFNLKRCLFCSNQCIFACRLPIAFFYFADFRWSFFSKIIGQKQRMLLTRKIMIKSHSSFIERSLRGNHFFLNKRAVFILFYFSYSSFHVFFRSVFIMGCFIFIFNLDSAWHITDNSVYLSNQQVAWVVAFALCECCHAWQIKHWIDEIRRLYQTNWDRFSVEWYTTYYMESWQAGECA